MDKATTSVASAWLLDSKRQRSGSVTEILQGCLRISRARLSHSAHQQLLNTASYSFIAMSLASPKSIRGRAT